MKQLFPIRPDSWLLLSFLIPLSVYLWCLAPSVTFYDSGEFITAVHFMGSAHSPGYPLFLLYAKPFTWLPIGNSAFRVNVATAFSAALACMVTYQLILLTLKDIPLRGVTDVSAYAARLAALTGALLFAFSPRLWLQSNHDKPYPLLTFMTGMILLCLLRWRDELKSGDEQPGWWYAAAYLIGLATGAHQTIILVLPGIVLFILLTDPGMIKRVREWLIATGFVLLGGMIQLYLPLRAAAGTRQNWGDVDGLSRFLWHLLRKGYPEEPHTRSISLLIKQLGAFDLIREFSLVGLLLLVPALILLWKQNRPLLGYVSTGLACFWLMIVGHFNPQADAIFLTEEFYTPLYQLAALVIAVGLYACLDFGLSRAIHPPHFDWKHRGILILFFMIMPLFQLGQNIGQQNQHRNYLAQDYAVNSLRPLPEEAVLFTWGDSGAFPLWYLQGVERLREDIDLPHIPHLVFPWYLHEQHRLSWVWGQFNPGGDAEARFKQSVGLLSGKRPTCIDFSTRHSLVWNGVMPTQQGIVFRADHTQTDSELIWSEYTLHRFRATGWLPDEDSAKAQTIHAYCLMQAAEDLARRGHVREASGLLNSSKEIMPTWEESLRRMAQRYGIPWQHASQKGD